MTSTVRLVDDTGSTLVQFTDDSSQAILTSLDLGFPTIREATTPLSGQDGEYDVTQLVGSRAIVAEVALLPDYAAANLDTLRALMHPARRYWLYVYMDGWSAERMIRVRGAAFAGSTAALPWTAQLGWKAAAPMWQDTSVSSATLSPQASAGGGTAFPTTLPMQFQPGLVPGAALLSVPGSANALPAINIYGPCRGPLLRVVDTGAQMSFSQLTINAGDYLHIDCAARTITLNSNAAFSQYQYLDFATSEWLSLPPGTPQVVFSPTSSSAPCTAVLTWRSQYL